MVAYTAEEQIRTMTSEAVAPQLRPVLVEIREMFATQNQRFERRFDEHARKLDAVARAGVERDRRIDALAAAGVERDRRLDRLTEAVDRLTEAVARLTHSVADHGTRLAAHDRKLDVIVAQLDGLKVLGRVIVGALTLLFTALMAVVGFLFTA